ncbi:MAG: hypothetical protein ACOX7K_08960 [Oscillospiraceae bacterium]
MQSKTSYFNKTLFRKNLTRFCPLWIAYLGFWLIALPFNFLQNYQYDAMCWEIQNALLASGIHIGTLVNFAYGLACAIAVFSYLFSARSANMLHAMPMRREELFVTNVLSGLLFAVIPNLIIVLFTILAEAVIGIIVVQATLQWFLINTFSFVFFYGFAVFLAQLTGNGFFLPFLYGILNIVVIAIEAIVRGLLDIFVYGYSASGFGILGKFSPVYYLEGQTSVVGENILYNTNNELVNIHYVYDSWVYLSILAVVGLLFALIGFVLYRRRNIESAGDVIAIRCLRPVFKYCFAAGFALVFGMFLYSFIQRPQSTMVLFLEMACFMLIGTFIGYFLAEILLQKSFRVFRKGWLGFGIVSLGVLALLTAVECDLFGYEQYVPNSEEVKSVLVDYGYRNYSSYGNDGSYDKKGSSDAELIEGTLALHKRLIQEKKNQENAKRIVDRTGYGSYIDDNGVEVVADWAKESFTITYELENGKTVTRCYDICYECSEQNNELNDPKSLISTCEAIFNDPVFVVLRSVPEVKVNSAKNIQYCNINYPVLPEDADIQTYDYGGVPYEYQSLTAEEAYELFTTCILPDLQDGLMGKTSFDIGPSKEEYTTYIELCFREGEQEYGQEGDMGAYIYYPTVNSERTNAFLKELGITSITQYEESQYSQEVNMG